MSDIDPDDVAAMRRENGGSDFRLFMRQQIAAGKARRDEAPPKTPAPRSGRPPGAWPAGTHPPGPLKPQPPGAWEQALARYRVGADRESAPCHCGGCDTPATNRKETK